MRAVRAFGNPFTTTETAMSVAKVIEISSESNKSFDDAIEQGLQKAASSVDHIDSAWIKDQIVVADDGKIKAYRVHMHVTFRIN